MRQVAGRALVAAVLLVAAVAWRAPATLVATRVAQSTGGRVTLSEARGTIWHGHGVLATGDARIALHWHFHAIPMLRGEIVVDVSSGAAGVPTPRGRVVVDARGARFSDFALVVPATALADAVSRRPKLDAAGTIDLAADKFEWRPPSGSGAVTAIWHAARIGFAGGESIGLGEVSAVLSATEGRLAGPVRNSGGEFSLDGELAVQANGAGRLRLAVQSRRADDARLAALAMLGTRQASGVLIDWQWPGP